MKVTADTITDEQIRELRVECADHAITVICRQAVSARDMTDAIEWGAVRRGNGFRHLRANVYKGHAHGLEPEWNGAIVYHVVKNSAWVNHDGDS